jgi:hypothetical protein
MKKNITFLLAFLFLASVSIIIASCEKDPVVKPPVPPTITPTVSFVEEFNNVGDLSAKGWVITNKSKPVGQTGWRQGRYEATSVAKFGIGAIPYIGFPAYTASQSPNDFISADITAVNDNYPDPGNISAWLISPALPMKNGDVISFYSRAMDDAAFSVYLKDRMQVWLNTTDGTANVGNTDLTTGSFTTKLLDINPDYVEDALGGYPQTWTKYTITLSGLPAAGIPNGRFAFRYFALDAGVNGGSSGANYPSVVGIDHLSFTHN